MDANKVSSVLKAMSTKVKSHGMTVAGDELLKASKVPKGKYALKARELRGFALEFIRTARKFPDPEKNPNRLQEARALLAGASILRKAVLEEPAIKEISDFVEPKKEPAISVTYTMGGTPPSVEERILRALKAEPNIGKSRIIELSGITEKEYVSGSKSLLSKNLIKQEGERKGAKYHVL